MASRFSDIPRAESRNRAIRCEQQILAVAERCFQRDSDLSRKIGFVSQNGAANSHRFCFGGFRRRTPWSATMTISAIRFGETDGVRETAHWPQLRFRRAGRLLSKAGLPGASICDDPVIGRRRRRPSIGCRPRSLQVVLTRPRPAADIQESRAGAKSPTLNVDAPTQGTVGKCRAFCFIRTMESAIA